MFTMFKPTTEQKNEMLRVEYSVHFNAYIIAYLD